MHPLHLKKLVRSEPTLVSSEPLYLACLPCNNEAVTFCYFVQWETGRVRMCLCFVPRALASSSWSVLNLCQSRTVVSPEPSWSVLNQGGPEHGSALNLWVSPEFVVSSELRSALNLGQS